MKSSTNIQLEPTGIGSGVYAHFSDADGRVCAIQEGSSSSPTIWMGVTMTAPGGPEGRRVVLERMHLTREHVAAILPHLHAFVESGRITAAWH